MNDSIKHHVSIILCHYSKADDFGEERARGRDSRSVMLKKTIESLVTHTDYPVEIIVADNGGKPDDSDYLLEMVRAGNINTYIRNKDNMYFGWAWNQAARLATGDYLCFTCNDIEFKKGWLETTIAPLLKYPEKKLIATPLITPDKDRPKYMRGELDGYRLNTLAGSNCFIIRKDHWGEMGEFSTSPVAGTFWHRRLSPMGFLVVATPTNMADHLAHEGGVDFHKPIKVKKTLLKGQIIDYSI